MIELGRDLCSDLSVSSRREWLVTNGIGGYASGTVSGIATRRYHGLGSICEIADGDLPFTPGKTNRQRREKADRRRLPRHLEAAPKTGTMARGRAPSPQSEGKSAPLRGVTFLFAG